MNELSLFSGAGGGLLASHLLGFRPIGYVEWDDYAQRVLAQRIEDGLLPRAPIFGDIRAFISEGYAERYRGVAEIVSGGFPCQDISSAGKGAGLAGDRSGLWFEMLRTIEIVRPRFVFAENSPHLRTRGLQDIAEGLTGLGYCVRWGVLGARHVGAPHERKRMWLVADTDDPGQRAEPVDAEVAGPSADACGSGSADLASKSVGAGGQPRGPQRVGEAGRNDGPASNAKSEPVQSLPGQPGRLNRTEGYGGAGKPANSEVVGCGPRRTGRSSPSAAGEQEQPNQIVSPDPDGLALRQQQGRLFGSDGQGAAEPGGAGWWDLPLFAGVDDGVAHRMDRVRCTGNGQVPDVAALAWEVLS